MSLDPQARAVLDQMAAAGILPAHKLTVEQARQALIDRQTLSGGQPEPVEQVAERRVPGPDGEIRVRIYQPAGQPPLPLLVYFHGGGWIRGSLDTHDGVCRGIANATPAVVISVDYRLAPEHRYPAAFDDAFAATCWAADNAGSLGGDHTRLAVGGDSAGGNLAAAVSLAVRDRSGPPIARQVLTYPVTNSDFETASYHANSEGYGLERADMIYYWQHYLQSPEQNSEPYAAPLQAENLAGLPAALMITAGYDPLCDEGAAYAGRLREAGVAVDHQHFPGMIHGFLGMAASIDKGAEAIRYIGAFLRT